MIFLAFISFPQIKRRWDYCRNNPDIFCQTLATCFAPETTPTKNNWNQNTKAYFTTYMEADDDFCHNHGGVNGCGPAALPDLITDVIDDLSGFEDACNSHDVCYANCEKTRQTCEDEFRADMYAECDGDFFCILGANLFAESVIAFGESSCLESREPPKCTVEQQNTCYGAT